MRKSYKDIVWFETLQMRDIILFLFENPTNAWYYFFYKNVFKFNKYKQNKFYRPVIKIKAKKKNFADGREYLEDLSSSRRHRENIYHQVSRPQAHMKVSC